MFVKSACSNLLHLSHAHYYQQKHTLCTKYFLKVYLKKKKGCCRLLFRGRMLVFFFHMEKYEYRVILPSSDLCVQPRVLCSVGQRENCFPTANEKAEQVLHHDVSLTLIGLVLWLQTRGKGCCIWDPFGSSHYCSRLCSSSWQPYLG